jgi:hypothetical protein
MDSFLGLVKSFLPQVHFYIMWFSLITSVTCLLSLQTRSLLNPPIIKILIFVLILFAGLTWVHDVTAMKNTPDFSDTLDDLELLTKKHEYSKLQRDVYLEGLELYSLFLLLILPRFHDYYISIIKAHERKLNQEIKASS